MLLIADSFVRRCKVVGLLKFYSVINYLLSVNIRLLSVKNKYITVRQYNILQYRKLKK